MKKIDLLLSLLVLFYLNHSSFGQNTCCLGSTVAPEISTTSSGTLIDVNQTTMTPVLAVNASVDLPNVEYIITKRGTAALDAQGQPSTAGGGGDVIIGADADGVFMPINQNRYGISLSGGDALDVMAVGYDLSIMRQLTDSLLNGVSPGSGPCCNLLVVISLVLAQPSLAGFCDTLNSAGIYSGSDVTDFNDVLTVLSPFVEGQLSVEALIDVFNVLNQSGSTVSSDCGGTGANNFMPYGMNGTERYTYNINMMAMANTCCSATTVAPEVNPGVHGPLIASNQNTPTPVLAVNASVDLPNVEYIITKRGVLALDAQGLPDTTKGGGAVVVGADVDGIFMPMNQERYGISLAVGDTFDITAIGYDLTMFQTLMDSLLNGVQNGQPCCDLFSLLATASNKPYLAGFCDSVNNAGVFDATDLNNMDEILSVFDAFNNSQTSLQTIFSTFEVLNQNGSFITSDCGGTGSNNFFSYGVHLDKKYAYVVDNALVVKSLSDVSLFMLYPNPADKGDINLYFTTKKEVDLTVNMFDALGQRVHHQVLGNVSGDFNTTISVQDLAAGMYYVELTDGHSNQLQKVIVK